MEPEYAWAAHEFDGARLPDERFRRQLVATPADTPRGRCAGIAG